MSVTGRIIKRWMARNVWMKSLKVLLLIQLDKVLGVLNLSSWNVSCAIEWVYSKRCLIKNWYLSSGLCERSLQTDGAVLLSFKLFLVEQPLCSWHQYSYLHVRNLFSALYILHDKRFGIMTVWTYNQSVSILHCVSKTF